MKYRVEKQLVMNGLFVRLRTKAGSGWIASRDVRIGPKLLRLRVAFAALGIKLECRRNMQRFRRERRQVAWARRVT